MTRIDLTFQGTSLPLTPTAEGDFGILGDLAWAKAWEFPGDGGPCIEILVGNGRLDGFNGTVEGALEVSVDGGHPTSYAMRLADGCCKLVRIGHLGWHPQPGIVDTYTRGGAPLPGDVTLRTFPQSPLPDDNKTATTGSGRVVHGRNPHLLAACLGAHDQQGYFRTDEEWLAQQAGRPLHWVWPDSGRTLEASDGDHVIGQKGIADLWSATEFYGRPVLRYGSASGPLGTEWWSYDHGHFTAEREFLLHALTGSPAALFIAMNLCHAAMSYPGFKPGRPAVLGYGDSQRHYGWTLRSLVTGYALTGDESLLRGCAAIMDSLDLCMEVTGGGSLGTQHWLCLNKTHGDSMEPDDVVGTRMQAHNYGDFLDRKGVAFDTTDLYDPSHWKQVRLWQHGILVEALGLAREFLPQPHKTRAAVMWRHGLRTILESATAPMCNVEVSGGKSMNPPGGLWRCFSPWLGAARPINKRWHYMWLMVPLLQGARLLADDVEEADNPKRRDRLDDYRSQCVDLASECRNNAGDLFDGNAAYSYAYEGTPIWGW